MKKIQLSMLAAIFAAGIYVGLIVNKVPYLKLDPKVDLIALGNLIAVLLLAVFIPTLINTRLDNQRCEKDLLIGELALFCDDLLKIDDALKSLSGKTPSKSEFTSVLALFKRARMHIESIETQIKIIKSQSTELQVALLGDKVNEYWDSVTGNHGIKLSNFTVTAAFLWKQSIKYDIVAKEARKLKFTINRL